MSYYYLEYSHHIQIQRTLPENALGEKYATGGPFKAELRRIQEKQKNINYIQLCLARKNVFALGGKAKNIKFSIKMRI